MSSRAEQKRKLREERIAREQEAADAARRRRRLTLLGASALVALVLVGILIAVSQSGDDEDDGGLGSGESITGVQDVRRLYRGIPQDNARLGDPAAPVTLVEFFDMQCPFCAEYSREVLPTLVERYVRPGRLRLEARPISILGPDSEKAAVAVAAAGQENRLWQYSDLAFLNQGAENSGYVTDDFLRSVARGAGVDPDQVVSESASTQSVPLLRQSAAEAQRFGISSTPSFLIGRRGQPLQPLEVSSLDPGEFTAAIDQALGR
jgi:protein-disulfide isomerase